MLKLLVLDEPTQFDTFCKLCEEEIEEDISCVLAKDKNNKFMFAFCSLKCAVEYINTPTATPVRKVVTASTRTFEIF
ncbi:MAG: hypothetical protein WDA12_02925 [Bacilli bacterium]